MHNSPSWRDAPYLVIPAGIIISIVLWHLLGA
jgi:hypothetical protein